VPRHLPAVILYRPVGLDELRLVARSGFREFPPRLPGHVLQCDHDPGITTS
jgi:hypothetical protein